jgi:hypothetical protein
MDGRGGYSVHSYIMSQDVQYIYVVAVTKCMSIIVIIIIIIIITIIARGCIVQQGLFRVNKRVSCILIIDVQDDMIYTFTLHDLVQTTIQFTTTSQQTHNRSYEQGEIV